MEKYPPYDQIAAPSERRKYYESARAEIINYKNMATIATNTSRGLAKDKHKYKQEAKVASKQLVQVTKKQKALDEAKKAGYWSGAATIGITILYETWKVVGFPGGHAWMDWWNHEAVYGVMVWCSTVALGWFYKAGHKD